jgi:hypothetical protein
MKLRASRGDFLASGIKRRETALAEKGLDLRGISQDV